MNFVSEFLRQLICSRVRYFCIRIFTFRFPILLRFTTGNSQKAKKASPVSDFLGRASKHMRELFM